MGCWGPKGGWDYRTELNQRSREGNFLAVQWLGLHTFTAEGPSSVPGQGTKLCSVAKKKKKREKKQTGKRRGKLSKCIIYLSICNKCLLSLSCYAKSLQSCPTLCNPIDSSPPASPVPGILQARTLEWVAISFSNCMKVKSESEVA